MLFCLYFFLILIIPFLLLFLFIILILIIPFPAPFQQPQQATGVPTFAPTFPSAAAFHVTYPSGPPPVPMYPPNDFVASTPGAAPQQMTFPGVTQEQIAFQQGVYNSQQGLTVSLSI